MFTTSELSEPEPDPGELIDQHINKIKFQVYSMNETAHVSYLPHEFELIGLGTNAIVVRLKKVPLIVYKIFAKETLEKLESEFEAYQQLQQSPLFAKCFGKGKNYLTLSYEKGPTLYECLEKGIIIPEQAILDVNRGIDYAIQRGLYPRDIHLKNVILQHNHAKIIDVASYLTPDSDQRWEHLVMGYYQIYPQLKGKRIPRFMIERIKRVYESSEQSVHSVLNFISKLIHFIR